MTVVLETVTWVAFAAGAVIVVVFLFSRSG